jgi:hypothetical protein
MKTKQFLLYLVVCSLAACTHQNDYPTIFIDNTIKQIYNDKVGSYWIYKDSITSELDSFVLVSSELGIDASSADIHGEKYEYLNLGIKQLGYNKPDSSAIDFKFQTFHPYNQFTFIINNVSQNQAQFWFDASCKNGFTRDPTNAVTQFVFSTPIILGSNSFRNVTCFTLMEKATLTYYSSCYWSDTVGLIKIRTPYEDIAGNKQIKVLELQRWHIIK